MQIITLLPFIAKVTKIQVFLLRQLKATHGTKNEYNLWFPITNNYCVRYSYNRQRSAV